MHPLISVGVQANRNSILQPDLNYPCAMFIGFSRTDSLNFEVRSLPECFCWERSVLCDVVEVWNKDNLTPLLEMITHKCGYLEPMFYTVHYLFIRL
jgi:hypothetical protein